MASFWERMREKFLPPKEGSPPATPPSPAPPGRQLPALIGITPALAAFFVGEDRSEAGKLLPGYPSTSLAAAVDALGTAQARIFDPGLQQFRYGFRLGGPVIEDPEEAARWRAARTEVMDHLLRVISTSRWNDCLVLRGSLLMKAWFGDAARDPGDIDWVVRPADIGIGDIRAEELLDGLLGLVSEQPRAGEATITAGEIAIDEIWTYERVPGKRIVFPWTAGDLPVGTVQMDLVFGEELAVDPELTSVPANDGGSALMWTATPELSLAWKLLWLVSDHYPQGKDLYDATLLAEGTPLRLEILEQVFSASEYPLDLESKPRFMYEEVVDWDNFVLEYPSVRGTAEDWLDRLSAALSPTFAMRERSEMRSEGPFFCATPRKRILFTTSIPASVAPAVPTRRRGRGGSVGRLPVATPLDSGNRWPQVDESRPGSTAELRRIFATRHGKRFEIIIAAWHEPTRRVYKGWTR